MKLLWFFAFMFQSMSFIAWLVNAPAETWHGIIYYPQLSVSATFVVLCTIVKVVSGSQTPPTRPV